MTIVVVDMVLKKLVYNRDGLVWRRYKEIIFPLPPVNLINCLSDARPAIRSVRRFASRLNSAVSTPKQDGDFRENGISKFKPFNGIL